MIVTQALKQKGKYNILLSFYKKLISGIEKEEKKSNTIASL